MKVLFAALGSLAGIMLLVGLVIRPTYRVEDSPVAQPTTDARVVEVSRVPVELGEHRRAVDSDAGAPTRGDYLEDHFGDRWGAVKGLYRKAGFDLGSALDDEPLPWEEVEPEVRHRALAILEREASLLRAEVAGWEGPIAAPELRNRFAVAPDADVEALAAELAPATFDLDERIRRLADRYSNRMTEAARAEIRTEEVETYPFAAVGPTNEASDLYRIQVEHGGWAVVYRIGSDEYPTLRRIADECRRLQAMRHEIVRRFLESGSTGE